MAGSGTGPGTTVSRSTMPTGGDCANAGATDVAISTIEDAPPIKTAISPRAMRVPRDVVPRDALPHDGVPRDAVSPDRVPRDAVPHDGLPKDRVPRKARTRERRLIGE